MTAALFDVATPTPVLDECADPTPGLVLTAEQREVLEMEAAFPRWVYPGSKEDAVWVLLRLRPARYYQLLNQCLDVREALEMQPVLVNRLRRLRSVREQDRARRRSRIVAGAETARHFA